MTIRKLVMTFVLTAFAIPGLAFAQDENRATVLLRNGDRVSGELEDVENGTVYVRVSQHDQRKLDVKNVALIDFAGGAQGLPETELSEARGEAHLALLRSGDSVKGQFVDIRGGEAETPGSNARTLVFRTTDGKEQTYPIDKVARVYLGNFPAATTANNAPAASKDPLPANAVRVPANSAWVATPLTVKKGDRVSFSATGKIQLSDNAEDVANPAGALSQRMAAGSPLPQNFAGALIAKVGNSAPFPIGDTGMVTMPADGQLYLGINDDAVGDNRGEFIVQINRQRR